MATGLFTLEVAPNENVVPIGLVESVFREIDAGVLVGAANESEVVAGFGSDADGVINLNEKAPGGGLDTSVVVVADVVGA